MSDWDGLRGCEKCGNDTTGRLCRSCRDQETIDNSDYAPMACIACYSVNYWAGNSGEKDWFCLDCGARWNSEDYCGRKD